METTSREQTFDPRSKWALVPEFFAPGTRNTFSPGWSHQPGLTISLVPGAKNSGTRAHFGRGSKVCSLLVLAWCCPTLWGSASTISPMIMLRRTAQCRPDAFTTSARATRRGIVPSHGTASAAAGREAWSLPVACVWWPACSPSAENLASTATGSRRRHYVRSLCFHRAFPLGATVLCAALPGPGCHAALPRRAMLLRRFRLPRARVPRVLCLKPLHRL